MKLKLFILVIAVQCVLVFAVSVIHEHALGGGKIILLETERVDPRDMLRGDYLILNYKISTVRRALFNPPLLGNLAPGTTVYVTVAREPRGKFYNITRVSTGELDPGANEVLLCPRIGEMWGGSDNIHLDYGIEKFYVAEGTGQPSGTLTVRAAVPSSGNAIIKEVLLDGEPYAEAVKPKQ